MSNFATAMTRLRDAQKSSTGAPFYSRFINRPLGRPLAAFAAQIGLSPTQVTLMSGLVTGLGIAGIAVLAPSWSTSILVTALLVLGYALDSADGQLARLTNTRSLSGEWLDHFFDAMKAATIHLAVFVCWYRFYDLSDVWLAIPLVFSAVASTFFFGVVIADTLRRIHHLQHPGVPTPAKTGGTSVIYSLLVAPADYGILCLTFILLRIPAAFIAVYGVLAVINLLLLFASGLRWYRSIRVLDRVKA